METINTLVDNFPSYTLQGSIDLQSEINLVTFKYDSIKDFCLSDGYCEINTDYFRGCSDLVNTLTQCKKITYHAIVTKHSFDYKSLTLDFNLKYLSTEYKLDNISFLFEVSNVRISER